MKVWKLVSGILSIILFVFVSFQSCAAGLSNALEANGEASGTAGIMVAVFMLAGGIVSIAKGWQHCTYNPVRHSSTCRIYKLWQLFRFGNMVGMVPD